MNVAGPSRASSSGRLAPRGRVESTYEDDLLGLLGQLSLDEMDEIQTFFTLRTRAGQPLSDHDVAMNDLLQQARALAAFDQDRALAQRVAAGEDVAVEQRPRPGVAPHPNGNGTAAQQNGNRQQGAQGVRNDARPSQTWGGWLSSVVGWVFGSKPARVPRRVNINTMVPRAPVVNRPTGHDCVICQDPIHGSEIRAPCGHYYDIACVTDLFQSATRDESLFPPRCCRQNILLAQVQPHLSQALVTTFQQKQVEFGTLKRVYCSSRTCSRFLGPLSEGIFTSKIYTCPAPGCGRRTCGKCREQHSGDWTHTCRPDADAAQVLELSRTSGWSRCPGCSQMIELHLGCYHMTCRCRTEFCYLCRARWKTCRCPQWDERRLLVAAEERVDAQLGRRGAPPAPVPANRVPAGVPVRLPAPAPAPVPARRPAPAPPLPRRVAAPAHPVAPARPVAVEVPRPQPTPARTPAASSSTARPVSTASRGTNSGVENWRNSMHSTRSPTTASASTSTSGSRSGWTSTPTPVRPKSIHDAVPTRQRLIREMMERLRVDHDCAHARWHYRRGGGFCQSCGDHLPLYLFRCQGCEMLACRRCKHNRL